jgi:DNA-binding transcriptional LysR family regulator
MDRLDSMAILIAVAEAGSLSAASRRLGTPLATVSRKISDLERRLGTRLLTRSSRKVALTEVGRSFLAASKRILGEVEEAERVASGEYTAPRGDLIITAPVVFGRLHVLPVVIDFLKSYPEIDVRLKLVDRIINLVEEHVDLAVRIGALPDSSLLATRVGAIRRVVCASPSYLAARGTPNVPSELSAHDCITFETMTEPTSWRFAIKGADVSVPIHSRLIVNTAEAAVDAAMAGLGLARVLSYQAAAALRTGTLGVVLPSFELAPWPVSLVHGGAPLLPLKLRAFLDFAAPRLKTRIAESEIAR